MWCRKRSPTERISVQTCAPSLLDASCPPVVIIVHALISYVVIITQLVNYIIDPIYNMQRLAPWVYHYKHRTVFVWPPKPLQIYVMIKNGFLKLLFHTCFSAAFPTLARRKRSGI